MGVARRPFVGGAGEIGGSDAAPDGRGAARMAAAVGMKQDARGSAGKPEELAGGLLHGAARGRRPPRGPEPRGLVQLAVGRRAEVEPLPRMSAAIGDGVRAGDHRLELEHPLRDADVVAVGVNLGQRRRADVLLERHLSNRRAPSLRAPARGSFWAARPSPPPTATSRAPAPARTPRAPATRLSSPLTRAVNLNAVTFPVPLHLARRT